MQLVLQQERTYDELAGLLGISADAVRERAHRGLERIAPGDDVDPEDRADLADYLLGQQSVSRRAVTRSLLAESPEARAWAREVAAQLRDVARAPLPEIPSEEAPEPAPVAAAAVAGAADLGRDEPAAEPDAVEPAADEPTVRARPRPRPTTEIPARPQRTESKRPRRSMLGGALLIAGLAILLVALVVFVLSSGDDNKDNGATKTSAEATATPTATATSAFQPLGSLPLQAATGAKGKGTVVILANPKTGQLIFTIRATDVQAPARGQAYAVWLLAGKKWHRLGFAGPPDSKGNFGTSGPRQSDSKNFQGWLTTGREMVLSLERNQDAATPAQPVLVARFLRNGATGPTGANGTG